MKLKNYFIVLITLILISPSYSNYKFYGDSKDLKTLHEKTFPISSGKELNLETSVGDVMITSWNKNEVYIKVLGNIECFYFRR